MSITVYLIAFGCILIYMLFYRKKLLSNAYKYFLAYLIFMLTLDFGAYILSKLAVNKQYLYAILNILILFEFNLLFLFYKHIAKEKFTLKTIRYFIFSFNTIYIISQITSEKYNAVATVSGSILIGITILLFLREFLISNKILNYKKELSFWVSFGLLTYYLGSTPIISLIYFSDINTTIFSKVLRNIQFFLSLFMYSCFIFGILWNRKRT